MPTDLATPEVRHGHHIVDRKCVLCGESETAIEPGSCRGLEGTCRALREERDRLQSAARTAERELEARDAQINGMASEVEALKMAAEVMSGQYVAQGEHLDKLEARLEEVKAIADQQFLLCDHDHDFAYKIAFHQIANIARGETEKEGA